MSKYTSDFFEPQQMKRIFLKKIVYNTSVGIDRVNTNAYMNNLTNNVELIQRKAESKSYKFTVYKEILLSKGRNKYPRVISVPTIRDRLFLQRINIYLQERYRKFGRFKLSQTIISEIIEELESKRHDCFIKIDMTNFYGTIDHTLLLTFLEKYKVSKQIINLIHEAINTPTVALDSLKCDRDEMNFIGVPQGLSISNVLASFYMLDLDSYFLRKKSIFYTRYVDDILILCSKAEANSIKSDIEGRLINDLKLELNIDKCSINDISGGFSFLGYNFYDKTLMPRRRAIKGIEKTIERLCRDYSKSKDKNEKYFLWNLNLKITGAISDNKKYGWLFYFSQITEKKVLFHLDWLVEKMLKRFGIKITCDEIKLKKFVRAFNEITLNLSQTKYIINIDEYDICSMNDFLVNIYGIEDDLKEEEIELIFKRVVFKSLSRLEKDLQTFS